MTARVHWSCDPPNRSELSAVGDNRRNAFEHRDEALLLVATRWASREVARTAGVQCETSPCRAVKAQLPRGRSSGLSTITPLLLPRRTCTPHPSASLTGRQNLSCPLTDRSGSLMAHS